MFRLSTVKNSPSHLGIARCISLLAVVVLSVSGASTGLAAIDNTSQQLGETRYNYLKAERALQRGQWTTYNQLKESLANYPLLAYLEYSEIYRSNRNGKISDLEQFVEKYPNFPKNRALYVRLLEHYQETGQWEKVLAARAERYDTCLNILALHRTNGEKTDILSRLKDAWLDGTFLTDNCFIVMSEMRLRLQENNELVWQRIDGAHKANRWRSVRQMDEYIAAADKAALRTLLRLRRNKRAINTEIARLEDTAAGRTAISYALGNYPSDYAENAYEIYKTRVEGIYSLTPEQTRDIEYGIGLDMTLENIETGFDLMFGLEADILEDEQHEWRARSAIKFAKWQELMQIINEFPRDLQSDATWLYWMGYATEKTSSRSRALQFYREAARQRNFYGFLAADKINQNKSFNPRPVSYSEDSPVLQSPNFLRFYELQAIGKTNDAIREWEAALRQASQSELLYLASAAYSQEWYFHSIRAFAVASYWDDLDRRFPLAYKDEIAEAASRNRIPQSLVYAIIRTESSFRPDVASSAGARGLMQILPSTGSYLIRKNRYSGSRNLINPQTSIDLGSAYLRELLNSYKGNFVLAIASYNAGPNAVKDWLPERGAIAPEEWIETVPYGETRRYIRTVLYAKMIYEWRQGRRSPKITRSMRPVRSSY